jgi:hypothetical protein
MPTAVALNTSFSDGIGRRSRPMGNPITMVTPAMKPSSSVFDRSISTILSPLVRLALPKKDWDARWHADNHAITETRTMRDAGMSYKLCYIEVMSQTITFRPDEDAERALAVLTADGTAVSAAVRSALIDAARNRAQQRLRAEAEALAADPEDRAEAAQVLRDMETLRAW